MRRPIILLVSILGSIYFGLSMTNPRPQAEISAQVEISSQVATGRLRAAHSSCFVPNLGQWKHTARFVHRSGPMTLFLEDRGWVLDLVECPVEPEARPHHAMPADRKADQKKTVTRSVSLALPVELD